MQESWNFVNLASDDSSYRGGFHLLVERSGFKVDLEESAVSKWLEMEFKGTLENMDIQHSAVYDMGWGHSSMIVVDR